MDIGQREIAGQCAIGVARPVHAGGDGIDRDVRGNLVEVLGAGPSTRRLVLVQRPWISTAERAFHRLGHSGSSRRTRGPTGDLDRFIRSRNPSTSSSGSYATDWKAEVERLLGLGARHVDWHYPDDADYVVLADPDGNRFCVVRKQAGKARLPTHPACEAARHHGGVSVRLAVLCRQSVAADDQQEVTT